eukprot:651866-Rhodomonas_salina.1
MPTITPTASPRSARQASPKRLSVRGRPAVGDAHDSDHLRGRGVGGPSVKEIDLSSESVRATSSAHPSIVHTWNICPRSPRLSSPPLRGHAIQQLTNSSSLPPSPSLSSGFPPFLFLFLFPVSYTHLRAHETEADL